VRCDLVVGADGRRSVVRERAQLRTVEYGAPMDVLWMRLSRREGDPAQVLGRINYGKILVMLDRGDYWQCGYIIRKSTLEELQSRGIQAFREDVAALAPFMAGRVDEIAGWDDARLLTVMVDRLERWYRPGLLCIGDAAHAMSPIGGVGINLAIQDAVAAANILAKPLLDRSVTEQTLAAVQARREWPTRMTQNMQVVIQNKIVRRVLNTTRPIKAPFLLRFFNWWPFLRRIPAYIVGVGFRPEHVRRS